MTLTPAAAIETQIRRDRIVTALAALVLPAWVVFVAAMVGAL